MNQANLPILCIEDDDDTCELITFVFEQTDYKVSTCSRTDCLNRINEEKFSAIILDNHFDGLKGIDICREIRRLDKTIPIIFFTGETREEEIDKALKAGANSYLVKPNDFGKLTETVIKLIEETEIHA